MSRNVAVAPDGVEPRAVSFSSFLLLLFLGLFFISFLLWFATCSAQSACLLLEGVRVAPCVSSAAAAAARGMSAAGPDIQATP